MFVEKFGSVTNDAAIDGGGTHQADLGITLIGEAANVAVVDEFANAMKGNHGCTMVFLDDNHNAEHVRAEMSLYAQLVTPGSYLIVADTVFEDLAGTPVGMPTKKYPGVKNPNPRVG